MSTYLITGIGRGIGQELARALLSSGECDCASIAGAAWQLDEPVERG